MDNKPVLDLGDCGGSWDNYESKLRDIVYPLWAEIYPNIKSSQLAKMIRERYETKRREEGLKNKISKMLNEDPIFSPTRIVKIDNRTYYIAREYAENDLNDSFERICSKNHRFRSIISLFQTDEAITYIHPVDMEADYSTVFSRIFQLSVSKAEIDRIFEWGEFWIEITYYDDDKDNKILQTAPTFLLDYLLARMWRRPTRNCKQNEELKPILRDLKKLLNYQCPLYMADYDIDIKTEDDDICLFEILKKIVNESNVDGNKHTVYLPSYTINTSKVFELYCYYVVSEQQKKFDPQYQIGFENSGGKPDIYVQKKGLVFDAKYKYQYAAGYCLTSDINQMIKYSKKGNANKVIILYPSINRNNDKESMKTVIEQRKNDYFQSIPLSYPSKSKR